jgi:glycosyltransferase involved in cell wall biosynthesis
MSELRSNPKVLHLIDSAGMYGAEKVVVTLLAELKDTDFSGVLGCIREREDEIPQIAIEATKQNIPVHYFTMKRGFNLSGIRSIANFIHDNKITVIHSHGYKPNIFLALFFSKQVKTVATVHGWSKETAHLKTMIYKYLDSLALKRMNCIIAVSKAIAKELMQRGLQANKIEIIYNGINVNNSHDIYHEDFSQLRKKYEISPNTFVIGTLGRLAAVKGHTYLIQAMPAIVQEIPNCKLLIAGDGPLKADLHHQIKLLNLENHAKLIGYIKDIAGLFSITDLFVLPSLSEGLPITLLEAMACGKPVVASAAGGIPEVITNECTGVLIPPADANGLAQAITLLHKDKDRMKKLSANSRELVENNFSAKSMASHYAMMYSQLITG